MAADKPCPQNGYGLALSAQFSLADPVCLPAVRARYTAPST
jgi:hypothetical protein